MEAFYRTHAYLVEHTNAPVRRDLMDEIDWNDRLIGIKGTRVWVRPHSCCNMPKKKFGTDRSCLFINMNNFYFSGHSIVDFAYEFQRRGGKVLLIDQVFKHPDWSKELRLCYDRFPNLKIVFTGSSVMRLKEEKSGIARHRKELQPAWFLLPRVSEPANRHEIPFLLTGRNPEQSRTNSQGHPVKSTPVRSFSGLHASWLLSFFP